MFLTLGFPAICLRRLAHHFLAINYLSPIHIYLLITN